MQGGDDIAAIREISPFSALSPEGFDALAHGGTSKRLPRNRRLVDEGRPADTLYIVTEGCVELFSSYAGRRTAVALIEAKGFFPLASTMQGTPLLTSARTLLASRLVLLPAVALHRLVQREADFAHAVIDSLAAEVGTLVKALKNQKLRNSQERVANYLLRLYIDNGEPERIALPTDKTTLAALLGMSRENLSRALTALDAHGVTVRGRQAVFGDPDALMTYARPDPLIDDGEGLAGLAGQGTTGTLHPGTAGRVRKPPPRRSGP